MIDPTTLSALLGQKFPPTAQQAAVIGAPLESSLVVAGAGAGKTETMAARVVWLVANGLVRPERVLGLTFTNKAAQQLGQRISTRLGALKASAQLDDIDALVPKTEPLRRMLEVIAPTCATYDSFAGSIVREFGLLMPVEPSARIIQNTELFMIADRVLQDYRGQIDTTLQPATIASHLVELSAEMESNLVDAQAIEAETHALLLEADSVPGGREKLNNDTKKILAKQELRLQLLPVVEAFRRHLREERLMTFNQQMATAATLAKEHPQVGATLRSRFDVVLLDEYQDTSYAQRVLLSSLFSQCAVTAVGDPMQSIYGWRGGTASNLEAFPDDFPNVRKSDDETAMVPARKFELTQSFRNPPAVLRLANEVATEILGSPNRSDRLVQPLEPLPDQEAGEVTIGAFKATEEEVEAVADNLARKYQSRGNEPFTAAVLMRKQSQFAAMEHALQERGVPVEVVGLSGLLTVAEVADMLAIATMLIHPEDNEASLRILCGPAVGLGAADLRALAQRASELSATPTQNPLDIEAISDPLEKLRTTISQVQQPDMERTAGLCDAVADLGEPQHLGMSAEAEARLRDLASKLRYLRSNAVQQSLPDLFSAIEGVFQIRTEVLQRKDAEGHNVGTAHLDRFAEVVEEFSRIRGASLGAFLRYTQLAIANDKGLEPGSIEVHSDRVQILTVHKAKGLEWQHVAVMHCDQETYKAKADAWLTQVQRIPSALLGDADTGGNSAFGSPVLEELDTETAARFAKSLKAHGEAFKAKNAAEAIRLFYVALTRAERSLSVSSSKHPPFASFVALKELVPEDAVLNWDIPEKRDQQDPQPEQAFFPHIEEPRGADLVMAAIEQLPELRADGDLFDTWEQDVTAIIEEHEALSNPAIEVTLPRELTATDLVALRQNPERFARRKRRPVPFKPNAYAKRGTAFHEWIEKQFGAVAFLDADELPGFEEFAEENLEELKQHFMDSEWYQRTPIAVEQGFELALGKHMLRGRIDAVFEQEDGFMVVDWKTGQPPTPAEMPAVEMQLAVYRLAWAKLRGVPVEKVQAAFYYVVAHRLVQPTDLPDEQALRKLLDGQNATR
ncbi:ATP-dependent helicase [Corynebacterium gerontici]|uniref:DNA 3'-5' helicase n=1 Tax=Corynebacterium gerontici TaxID=2079234 RepID=A0A3G6IZF5_9CORY|nr:UvrD-helicase domain-containing protein [Corynebacterium gerontici]AZA10893.1 ATP-dependent DNA helicase PcrA [Corynebacterium gerontici]